MEITTISINRPQGQEQQIDFRGDNRPEGLLVVLVDGRVITINASGVSVIGPDGEDEMGIAWTEQAPGELMEAWGK